MQTGKMRVFGCGGAGVNLASNYVGNGKEDISAEILPVFIDTSRSNIDKKIPDELCYILQDLDGSGKVRAENYEKIKDVVKDILHKHKPAAFNVVVFSASGGSGSVIGPLLVSEMLTRGETVVVVTVGSDESDITARNTLNTLKSLEGISKNTGKTVVMHYRHNTRGKARSDVDGELHYAISTLAVLASKNVRELDTRDIFNWINFNKTTSVEARLAALEIFGPDTPWGEYNPVSVISIYKDADQATLPIVPEYHCAGFADVMGLAAIHYLIDVTAVGKFATRINATLKELDEARKSRPSLSNLTGSNDKKTDDGLVL
jgi:hypothetical protein